MKTDTLVDRLDAAAKAKQALLERARSKDPTKDPEFAARQEARVAAARAREEREAERRRAKIEAREREVAEKKARREAEIRAVAEKAEREKADGLAAQKAALMARFGTRKKG